MTQRPIDHILKEKQKFEALFNFATVGIIIANAEGTITLVNQFAENIFGFGPNELLGEKVEILLPDHKKKYLELDRKYFSMHPQVRPMGVGLDLKGKRKDGSTIPVEISLSHFHSEEGLSVIAFILDISARKESEEKMLHQKAELEKITYEVRLMNANLEDEVERRTEALRHTLSELENSRIELQSALAKEKQLGELKSRFVTMASHEFKTPLSAIVTSATLIGKYQKEEDQPQRDKHLKKIQDTVINLTNILNEFLYLGKLEEGKIETRPTPFYLPEMIRELVNELQIHSGKTRSLTFQAEGKTLIRLDKDLLRNILFNLLSNAIKFSPEGGKIFVLSNHADNGLHISIEDNGIGVSAEDQEHLFKRFFRGRNADNIQGTGLGLHIVQRYVTLMKGRISFRSELNKGSIVSLHFPYT